MADDGEMKDDVKMPDGEPGKKIKDLFDHPEKDASKSCSCAYKCGISLTFFA
jgi:hypothetical protein